jgi:hypothetical protein
MFLQGDLQSLFDALYDLGVIDPVLEMDWSEAMSELTHHYTDFIRILDTANAFQGDTERLIEELSHYDSQMLGYLAMEVAREYADFHSRQALH